MKKLGLVGGVGPASTVEYYKGINEGYQKRMNRPSKSGENPPMVIESLNLAVAYDLVEARDWPAFTRLFVEAIGRLHAAGAQIAAISANTAHIVFDDIAAQSPIPVIGIVDTCCEAARAAGFKRLGVLGTGFTMASGMYEAAAGRYGLRAFVPPAPEQTAVHNIIFPNLEAGLVLPQEKAAMVGIAQALLTRHEADALVLGCTELPLMLRPGDLSVPLLDTTAIHIEAILDAMLG